MKRILVALGFSGMLFAGLIATAMAHTSVNIGESVQLVNLVTKLNISTALTGTIISVKDAGSMVTTILGIILAGTGVGAAVAGMAGMIKYMIKKHDKKFVMAW